MKLTPLLIAAVWVLIFIIVNPMVTEEYVPSPCNQTGDVICLHQTPSCIKYSRIIDDGLGVCCESCMNGWNYCPPSMWVAILFATIPTIAIVLSMTLMYTRRPDEEQRENDEVNKK